MPFITVKLPTKEYKLDVEKLGNEISTQTPIELNRLNVILSSMDSQTFFRGNGTDYPAVHVEASARNGKEFIQKLLQVSTQLVEKQLNLPENSVTGYAHPIEEGYLLKSGEFR
ncbi:MAG TPA: hypothetical protein DDX29_10865 [Clostridiales bacterium]|nr:hypothetical protein [Clostridiales bacterium]